MGKNTRGIDQLDKWELRPRWIFGCLNICQNFSQFQIFGHDFCLQIFFSTSQYLVLLFFKLQQFVKIYEAFDIHSHGISSFNLSLKTLRATNMEGKIY